MKPLKAVIKVSLAKWDKALHAEYWCQPACGPLRFTMQVSLQCFAVSLQVSDSMNPPCYCKFVGFELSPYILCRGIADAYRMSRLRTIKYATGQRVVLTDGYIAEVAHMRDDGTVLVTIGFGGMRRSRVVHQNEIRRNL